MATEFPTAEEVFKYAKEQRIKLEPGEYWDPALKCGCFAGVAAIMADPSLVDSDDIWDKQIAATLGVRELGVRGAIDGFDGYPEDNTHKHRALYRRMYAEGRKLRLMIEPDAFGEAAK